MVGRWANVQKSYTNTAFFSAHGGGQGVGRWAVWRNDKGTKQAKTKGGKVCICNTRWYGQQCRYQTAFAFVSCIAYLPAPLYRITIPLPCIALLSRSPPCPLRRTKCRMWRWSCALLPLPQHATYAPVCVAAGLWNGLRIVTHCCASLPAVTAHSA